MELPEKPRPPEIVARWKAIDEKVSIVMVIVWVGLMIGAFSVLIGIHAQCCFEYTVDQSCANVCRQVRSGCSFENSTDGEIFEAAPCNASAPNPLACSSDAWEECLNAAAVADIQNGTAVECNGTFAVTKDITDGDACECFLTLENGTDVMVWTCHAPTSGLVFIAIFVGGNASLLLAICSVLICFSKAMRTPEAREYRRQKQEWRSRKIAIERANRRTRRRGTTAEFELQDIDGWSVCSGASGGS